VPPSIKRRTTSSPNLSRTTSSSSIMDSRYDFGIQSLPVVFDEVGTVDDDAKYHSGFPVFELQPVKPTSRTAPPVRPKLQRRDTPVPRQGTPHRPITGPKSQHCIPEEPASRSRSQGLRLEPPPLRHPATSRDIGTAVVAVQEQVGGMEAHRDA
jgi:hypothetical protein